MNKIAQHALTRGYSVANIDYPSRELQIEELAPLAVEAGLAECPAESTKHFVTHSLGGILVRYYLEHHRIPNLGRVVMLAPPNAGSQVVDAYRDVPGYKMLNGAAGLQLGTDADSIPLALGPADFELGIIAGTDTINPILSQFLPNPDDGKVSVENTKVEGMSDFIAVPHSHALIIRAQSVIDQVFSFIESGSFAHDVL